MQYMTPDAQNIVRLHGVNILTHKPAQPEQTQLKWQDNIIVTLCKACLITCGQHVLRPQDWQMKSAHPMWGHCWSEILCFQIHTACAWHANCMDGEIKTQNKSLYQKYIMKDKYEVMTVAAGCYYSSSLSLPDRGSGVGWGQVTWTGLTFCQLTGPLIVLLTWQLWCGEVQVEGEEKCQPQAGAI